MTTRAGASLSPLARARDWLVASDPGGVRLRHGVRTVLAALATFATLEGVLTLLGEPRMTGAVTYGVIAAFTCSLSITDPRRHDRAITLGWGVVALAVAAGLATLSASSALLSSLVLLVLVFLAFAARRWGPRAGELAVVTAVGTYFAISQGAAPASLPWFVVAAGVGVGWLVLLQLVLLPYDPVRSILRATRAYAVRLAGVVAGVSGRVAAPVDDAAPVPTGRPSATADGLAHGLRLIQLTRRVLEAQFPGARAPGGWTSAELTRLQVAVYDAELGSGQMVDGCADPDALATIPVAIRDALGSMLDAIAAALRDAGDPWDMETLAARADDLDDRLAHVLDAIPDEDPASEGPPPAWVVSALRIASGAERVARAVATVRSLRTVPGPTGTGRGLSPARPPSTGAQPPRPLDRPGDSAEVRMAGRSIHVTTALGLQAVLATGLSMAIAWIVGVEHQNWVFWTSFVVIAGSLDESLRRILQRVAGTLLGVLIGVVLSALLPHDLLWVVLGASIGVFMAIYSAPISHAWFVLWINVAFVILYALPGGRMVEILVERPLTTAIGAAIAAIVVVRILPIRRSGRYTAALVAFLASIRDAIGTWTRDAVTEDQATAPLPVIEAAYRQVEALSHAHESGTPFGPAHQAAERESTRVAALAIATRRLGMGVEMDPESAHRHTATAVAGRVEQNLGAVMSLAGGVLATISAPLEDLLVPGRPLAHRRTGGPQGATVSGRQTVLPGGPVLAALVDVHGSVVRLGTTLTARLETTRRALRMHER